LLFSSIPHGAEIDEGRLANGLKNSKKDTQSNERREVLGNGVEHENCSPQNDRDTQILGYWKASKEVICWVLYKKNGDVDLFNMSA
jgi:hypothetical protein